MISDSTKALTMFPFILHLVMIISFVFVLSHARWRVGIVYSVADTKDLHTFTQCPFFKHFLQSAYYGLDIGNMDDMGLFRSSKSL